MRFLSNLTDTLVNALEDLTSSTSGTGDGRHGCGTLSGSSSHYIDTALRIHTGGSLRAHLHASFLGGSSGSRSGSSALSADTTSPDAEGAGSGRNAGRPPIVKGPWSSGVCQIPTAFKTLRGMKGQKLGPVRLRLVYQSPELYSTDYGEYDKKTKSYVHGCKFSNKEPDLPPFIRWKKMTKFVHLKLKDTKTNEILYDADLRAGFNPFGSTYMDKRSAPLPGPDGKPPILNKLCIPSWEQGPRLFELKVCSRDYHYKDQMDTEAGEREGWHGLDIPCGHIGVEAYRVPITEGKDLQSGHPKLGRWKWNDKKTTYSPGNFSEGDVHYFDPLERFLHREINVLEDPATGDDGTLYYPWIYNYVTKSKGSKYEWLFKLSPPQLVGDRYIKEKDEEKIIEEERKQMPPKDAPIGRSR